MQPPGVRATAPRLLAAARVSMPHAWRIYSVTLVLAYSCHSQGASPQPLPHPELVKLHEPRDSVYSQHMVIECLRLLSVTVSP